MEQRLEVLREAGVSLQNISTNSFANMTTFAVIPYSNLEHRSQVMALWREVFGYQDARNQPDLVIDKKIAVDDGLFFVAVADGTVVGTTMAGYDGHRGWIYSVAVSPLQRRKGIGSSLIAYAERELTAKGCVKINLQLLEGNASVTDFYAALGYAVEKRINMGKEIAANISGV